MSDSIADNNVSFSEIIVLSGSSVTLISSLIKQKRISLIVERAVISSSNSFMF
ncbi:MULTISPECIES: hypothetical protein [unclassified Clostridioides]|uniref:hypothetical protein n=1 Tax=unclassified Clostridioides TaxID=2635829 RepID=UPI001D1279B3